MAAGRRVALDPGEAVPGHLLVTEGLYPLDKVRALYGETGPPRSAS